MGASLIESGGYIPQPIVPPMIAYDTNIQFRYMLYYMPGLHALQFYS